MTKPEITVRVGDKGLVVRAGAVETAPTIAMLTRGTLIQVSALRGGVLFGHLVSDDQPNVLAGQWLRVGDVGYAWTPEDLRVVSAILDHQDQSQQAVDDVRRIAMVTLARYLESVAAGEDSDLAFEGAVQDTLDKYTGEQKLELLAQASAPVAMGSWSALAGSVVAPRARKAVLEQALWTSFGVSLTREQAVTVICDLVQQLGTPADLLRVDLTQDQKGANENDG